MIKAHLKDKFDQSDDRPGASDHFSYGDDVYHIQNMQTGVVVSTAGRLVFVRYYDKQSGELAELSTPTPMHRLCNFSTE